MSKFKKYVIYEGECSLCGEIGELDFDRKRQIYHCTNNYMCQVKKAKDDLVLEICKSLKIDKLTCKLGTLINKLLENQFSL